MKLEQSFEVQAPLEQVWRALIDVERVAPCLPGAAVTGRNDDGTYAGTFSVKVGPTSASYSGKLEMRDIDDTAHTATMYAQGSDRRGQGGATATIVSRLAEIGGNRTRVEVATDYRITGRLARFGRGGMIEDISQKLLRRFADCLQASLAEGPSAADASAAGAGAAGDGGPVVAGNGTEPHPPEAAPAAPSQPEAAPAAASSQPEASSAAARSQPEAAPAGPEAEPLSGLSLVGGVLADRIRANPAPVIAAAAVLLLLVSRRRRWRRRRRQR